MDKKILPKLNKEIEKLQNRKGFKRISVIKDACLS